MSNPPAVALHYPTLHTSADRTEQVSARAAGYAAGFAEGSRNAQLEYDRRLNELETSFTRRVADLDARAERSAEVLRKMTDAVTAACLPVISDAEHAMAVGAVELAEAILHQELSDDETAAKAAIRGALAHPAAPLIVTVRVNPSAVPYIETLALPFIVTADPTLNAGDCVAELPAGILNNRVGDAVTRARTAILGGEL